MFQTQANGYDKQSVDAYISKLKNEIMEQKLSLLDSEQKFLQFREKRAELENREKNLYKAVRAFQDAQKIKNEGTKTLCSLKVEQLSLLNKKAETLIKTIYLRHPELENDTMVKELLEDFQHLLESTKKKEAYKSSMHRPISTGNDSMRILLSKMQEYRNAKAKPKEIRIERVPTEAKLQIKPVCSDSLVGDVDDFLKQAPIESNTFFKKKEPESGFNLEEAVNPKEDLETIMQAFDFFNNEDSEQ